MTDYRDLLPSFIDPRIATKTWSDGRYALMNGSADQRFQTSELSIARNTISTQPGDALGLMLTSRDGQQYQEIKFYDSSAEHGFSNQGLIISTSLDEGTNVERTVELTRDNAKWRGYRIYNENDKPKWDELGFDRYLTSIGSDITIGSPLANLLPAADDRGFLPRNSGQSFVGSNDQRFGSGAFNLLLSRRFEIEEQIGFVQPDAKLAFQGLESLSFTYADGSESSRILSIVSTTGASTRIGCVDNTYSSYQSDSELGHLFDKGLYVLGEVYAGTEATSRVYHTGFKPSKIDVGLDMVNNWGATSDFQEDNPELYATSQAVTRCYEASVKRHGDTLTGDLLWDSGNFTLGFNDSMKGYMWFDGAVGDVVISSGNILNEDETVANYGRLHIRPIQGDSRSGVVVSHNVTEIFNPVSMTFQQREINSLVRYDFAQEQYVHKTGSYMSGLLDARAGIDSAGLRIMGAIPAQTEAPTRDVAPPVTGRHFSSFLQNDDKLVLTLDNTEVGQATSNFELNYRTGAETVVRLLDVSATSFNYLQHRIYHQGFKPDKTDVGLSLVQNFGHTSEVNDPSENKYATAHAVKKVHDLASTMLPLAGGTVTGMVDFTKGLSVGRDGEMALNIGEGLEFRSQDDYFPGSTYYDARIIRLVDMNGSGGYVDGGLVIEGYTKTDGARKELLVARTDGTFTYQGTPIYCGLNKPNNSDVGLSNINNWVSTNSATEGSSSKYATGAAVKQAYDHAQKAINDAANLYAKKAGDLNQAFNASRLTLKYGDTDTAWIGTTASGAATYLDTYISDDPAQDRFRWLFSAYGDASDDSLPHAANVQMQLYATAIGQGKARLDVFGEMYAGPDGLQRVYHAGWKPTKADVGLSNVQNYGFTTAVNSTSTTTYASASAVKQAYDLATTAKSVADGALQRSGGVLTGITTVDGIIKSGNNIIEVASYANTEAVEWVIVKTNVAYAANKMFSLHIQGNGMFGNAYTSPFKAMFGWYFYDGAWYAPRGSIDCPQGTVKPEYRLLNDSGKVSVAIPGGYYGKMTIGLVNGVAASSFTNAEIAGWTTRVATTKEVESFPNHLRVGLARSYSESFKPSKADVQLSLVNNWEATSAVDDASNTKYATAGAVKQAYDKAQQALDHAAGAGDSYTLLTLDRRELKPKIASIGRNAIKGWFSNSAIFNCAFSNYSDVITLNTYSDRTGGKTNALVISKQSKRVALVQGDWDAEDWDAEPTEFYTTEFKPGKADVGLSNVNNWTATSATNSESTTTYATAAGVKAAYDLAVSKITKAQADGYYLAKTAKAADSAKLNGVAESTGVTADTIAKRDTSGDIHTRLVRSNYMDQNTIAGAIAFRVNNGSDNYVRFCNSNAAVRIWLGLGNVYNWGATSAVDDASTTKYATASAVKQAYDKASAALPLAGGNMTGNITFNGDNDWKGISWGDGGEVAYIRQSSVKGQIDIGSDAFIRFVETDTNVEVGFVDTNVKSLKMHGMIETETKVKIKKCELVYNDANESMDFIFV